MKAPGLPSEMAPGVRSKKSTNAACCVRVGHWLDEESDLEADDLSIHHALAVDGSGLALVISDWSTRYDLSHFLTNVAGWRCHVRRTGSYGTEKLITPGEPRSAEANRKTITVKREWTAFQVSMRMA